MTFELSKKEIEDFLRSKTDKVLPNAIFFPIEAYGNQQSGYDLDLSFHVTMPVKSLAPDWKPAVLRNTKDFLAKVRDQLDLAIKDLEETP